MTDVLERYANQHKREEVYEIVKTAVIVRDEKVFRIEVRKCYSNPAIPYTTACFTEEYIGGKTILVHHSLPWTSRDDADGALAQALGFFSSEQYDTAAS
jgi:hypothetical protein